MCHRCDSNILANTVVAFRCLVRSELSLRCLLLVRSELYFPGLPCLPLLQKSTCGLCLCCWRAGHLCTDLLPAVSEEYMRNSQAVADRLLKLPGHSNLCRGREPPAKSQRPPVHLRADNAVWKRPTQSSHRPQRIPDRMSRSRVLLLSWRHRSLRLSNSISGPPDLSLLRISSLARQRLEYPHDSHPSQAG